MADSDSNHKISLVEIGWVAGFLEGEGSFAYGGGAQVMAAQVQREPLDRLKKYFGGSIWQRQTKGFSKKPIWIWATSSNRAIQVMMTIYVLMSPRRQAQIATVIEKWKLQKLTVRPHFSFVCMKGHSITGDNVVRNGKYIGCKICKNARRIEWRAKRREAGLEAQYNHGWRERRETQNEKMSPSGLEHQD